jgi:hypothetical protein
LLFQEKLTPIIRTEIFFCKAEIKGEQNDLWSECSSHASTVYIPLFLSPLLASGKRVPVSGGIRGRTFVPLPPLSLFLLLLLNKHSGLLHKQFEHGERTGGHWSSNVPVIVDFFIFI